MNSTIVRLSAQAILGRRRVWIIAILPMILVLLSVVVRLLTEPGVGYVEIISGLGMRLVLPLVALLAATSVLGPEIDDGSVVYLLAKPVNRYVVAISKYAVALGATVLFGAVPIALSALVIDPGEPRWALGYFVGAAVGSATYTALFLALSALTRHAVIVGLLIAFVWESLLAGLLSGIARVSPGAWGNRVAQAVAPDIPVEVPVALAYAVVASLLLCVLGAWYAGRQLSGFSLTGED